MARTPNEPMADEDEPRFDVPDVQIIGTVYKMSLQTDRRGAVLVAYSQDGDNGRIGRSFIRFDEAGLDYLRSRLVDGDGDGL
ncbi:hypothetical protein [Streptomyces flavofungini]|uniref:hypothetical protein n=1 Tax=Streptomyces flavofungini TaxID=68200 RepID=UPI0025AF5025|nr:hypothetical protein [Streptomyces flavofungini]WJV51838.1 hypothetical protein QUY26_40735 [Streptomyces flavofungini]WJV51880.1 hypothetical protein QUY26_40610 [Streptomyces flavofungini]